MKAVPTRYDGTLYRSRTEARWAIFFDCAGISFLYEPDGYRLGSETYLPDFWLPGFDMFFEVKGQEPTGEEAARCAALTMETETDMLLAAGAPAARFQIHWFYRGGRREHLYVLARDFASDQGFYLVAENDEHENWIGPVPAIAGIRRGPMLSGALELAYETAGAARFEHGQVRHARYARIDEPDEERRAPPPKEFGLPTFSEDRAAHRERRAR